MAVEICPTMLGTLALAMADAEGRFARHDDTSGKFTALTDVAVLQVVAHLVGHHDRAVVLRLARGGAQVRQGDHAGMAGMTRRRENRRRSSCSCLPASAASTASSLTTPSREKLSSTAPCFHAPDSLCVDQVARRIQQRHMQGDEMAVLQDLVDAVAPSSPAKAGSRRRPR